MSIRELDDLRDRAQTAPAPYVDRHAAVLGNTITPARLTALLADRNEGNLQSWIDFADEMRRASPHLHAQLAVREGSVVETDFAVQPGTARTDAQRAAADVARAACESLVDRWRERGLDTWLAQWTAAAYYGRCAHEVLWAEEDGYVAPACLEHIAERRLSLACDWADPHPWDLRLWDADAPAAPRYGRRLAEFGPDKILAHEPRVLGGLKTAEGLFSTLVWYTVFVTWSWRDLMSLNEMVGRPPVVAYYAAGGARGNRDGEFNGPRDATDKDKEVAAHTVFRLTGSLRAVLPDTVRLEVLKFPLPTSTPVQLLTEERANALISKAVTGVANLSDLQPGARAAVEAQERVSATVWRADCRRVAGLMNRLFAWFVRANPQAFGVDCPVPRVVFATDPPADRVAFGQALDGLQKAGLAIPRGWAYRTAQVPEPAPDEQVLAPVAPAPVAPAADDVPGAGAPPTDTPAEPPAKESPDA